MDLSQEEKISLIKKIIWDYNIDPLKIIDVISGKLERIYQFDAEKIFIRMLERLTWYDLINILGIDRIKSLLTADVIEKLRDPYMQEKYEFVRRILQKEAVSFSGWDPEHRKKIRYTLLSNRWYRSG